MKKSVACLLLAIFLSALVSAPAFAAGEATKPSAGTKDDPWTYGHYAMVIAPENLKNIYIGSSSKGDGSDMNLVHSIAGIEGIQSKNNLSDFDVPSPDSPDFESARRRVPSVQIKVGAGSASKMNWWLTLSTGDLCLNWFRTYKDADGYGNIPAVNLYGADTPIFYATDKYDKKIRNLQYDQEAPAADKGQAGKPAEDSTEPVITATTGTGTFTDVGRGLPVGATADAQLRIQDVDNLLQEINNVSVDGTTSGKVKGNDSTNHLTPKGVREYWQASEPFRRDATYDPVTGRWDGGSSRKNDLAIIRAYYQALRDNQNSYSFGAKFSLTNLIRGFLLDITKPLLTAGVKGMKYTIKNGSNGIIAMVLKDGKASVVERTTADNSTIYTLDKPEVHSVVIWLYDYVRALCFALFVLVVILVAFQGLKADVLSTREGKVSAMKAGGRIFGAMICVLFAKYVFLAFLYLNQLFVQVIFKIPFFSKANMVVTLDSVGLGEMIWILLVAILLIVGVIVLYALYTYRMVALAILLVISPLAFLAMVMESTHTYFQRWLNTTISTIFLQTMHVFIYATFLAIYVEMLSIGPGVFGTGGVFDSLTKYLVPLMAIVAIIILPPKFLQGSLAHGGAVFGAMTAWGTYKANKAWGKGKDMAKSAGHAAPTTPKQLRQAGRGVPRRSAGGAGKASGGGVDSAAMTEARQHFMGRETGRPRPAVGTKAHAEMDPHTRGRLGGRANRDWRRETDISARTREAQETYARKGMKINDAEARKLAMRKDHPEVNISRHLAGKRVRSGGPTSEPAAGKPKTGGPTRKVVGEEQAFKEEPDG